jgi:hypothetical protein
MIRLSTLLWIALAGAVGFGVFQLKHEMQALEDELFRLNRSIMAEQQAIHVLKAEWSYINQPDRLQALVKRHLDLEPVRPAQLGTLADLPERHDNIPATMFAATPSLKGVKSLSPVAAKPNAGKGDVGLRPANHNGGVR